MENLEEILRYGSTFMSKDSPLITALAHIYIIYNIMEIITQPYTCEICNYVTFVKKNLLWHNSCESHLSRVRHKPNAL